jgi:hypothetical protein
LNGVVIMPAGRSLRGQRQHVAADSATAVAGSARHWDYRVVNSGRVAALAWALCLAMAAASAVFLLLGPARPAPDDVFGGVGGASFVVLSLTLATIGALVAARAPANRIGWVFCATGLVYGGTILAWAYADYSVHASSTRLPGSTVAALLPTEPTAAMLAFALLLFPDGHLPSRRWRVAAWLPALAAALLLVTDVLRPGALDAPFAMVSNPLGIPGTRGVMNAINNVGWGAGSNQPGAGSGLAAGQAAPSSRPRAPAA